MAGLSRRRFLGLTAALAASFGLPRDDLARVAAQPLAPADVPTTLQQTILQRTAPQNRSYRLLTAGPGESLTVRTDLLAADPSPGREAQRRSLAYVGHTSDIHIIDAQTPAWLDPASNIEPGASRPQEAMSVHVHAAMVTALSDAARSPVTGAPMLAVLNTGDNSDRLSNLELRWCIDTFDGLEVLPNSGDPNTYEGVQVWPEATYAYHPDDPSIDPYGAYGFPTIPGLMDSIVTTPVRSPGSPAPWYTVYGNHDTLMAGTFSIDQSFRNLATGSRKAYTFAAMSSGILTGAATDVSALTRGTNALRQQFGLSSGVKKVTADPNRRLLAALDFMKQHFDSPATPGPVGHGFTQDNLASQTTYWSADIGPALQVFGLDTCNLVIGADGALPRNQFEWLEAGIQQAAVAKKLVCVLSHHNSLTLDNTAQSVLWPREPLVHAEEFLAMLLKYPNVVAWLNGHTHINTIQAHPRNGTTGRSTDSGGLWEITTASCIDYPQQSQVVEIIDNRDGTISLIAITLDHASDPQWRDGDFSPTGLASLSRQFAANDWTARPMMHRGSPLDRNVEMLLPAPFDLSGIGDDALEATFAMAQARQSARAGGTRSAQL